MSSSVFRCDAFERALNSLEEGLRDPGLHSNVLLRDGVIQRFEYTFELAWKMIQRVLGILGQMEEEKLMSKKDLFRLAAQKGLLTDPEAWFVFLEARNESAHLYNAVVAERLFKVAQDFASPARELLATLKKYESEN